MARGQEEKQQVIAKILEMFPGAFEYDKHIRVPMGEYQVKVTLAVAKENVTCGEDIAIPGDTIAKGDFSFPDPVGENKLVTEPVSNVEATDEEKKDIADLMATLGL